MLKKLVAFAAVGGMLGIANGATAAAPAPAPAHKAGMTCEEFLSLDTVTQPKIVYWVEGVKHKGKWHDAVIDTVSTDQVIPIVVEKCKAAPKASFWQKLDASWNNFEAWGKKHI